MQDSASLETHEWMPPGGRGANPPVAVLVHGVSGWHRTWWRVGPALAERGWRVIGVDQRGHGHSPRIDGVANVGDLAADLAAVVEGAGTPVDVLIGHSLGAAVAAELAILRPELIRRLVLEDPPAVTRTDDVEWQARLEAELLASHADFDDQVARHMAAHPEWEVEDARQDIEGRQLADGAGILASFRRGTQARVLELAPRLTMPALWVLAAEDRSVFAGDARRQLLATLPATARLVVADAGHTVHRDRFDWYVSTILDWLAESAAVAHA